MNRNTRILAISFGAVMAYVLISNVVYPSWIRPLLTLDQRVAEKEKELGELLKDDEAVDRARSEYRTLVGRIGSFNVGKVQTDVRTRLVAMIEKYHLEDVNVAPSSRPVEDRRTGLTTAVVTVSAVGNFDSAVQFLREAAELPHLSRVGNVSISPAGGAKKSPDAERVSFRAPIELLILPKNKVVGPIDEKALVRADVYPRYSGRDYSKIWKDKPFSDWVPPIPLQIRVAKPNINVEVNAPVTLEGLPPTGGDGQYTVHWSPPDGLSDPSSLKPTLDTSTLMANKPYLLTVTDGTGGPPATAQVTVTVHDKPPPTPDKVVDTSKPPLPPPPPKPVLWKDDKNLQLCMALMRSVGDNHVDEVMITNTRTKENKYYKAGDDFDGGQLIFVHQRGALVHRIDGYFVYPLGNTLEAPLALANADEYPELKSAAEKHKALVEADRETKHAAAPKPATTPEVIKLDDSSSPPGGAESKGGVAPENGPPTPAAAGKPAGRSAQGQQPGTKEGHGPTPSMRPEAGKPVGPKPPVMEKPAAAPQEPATTDAAPSDDAAKPEAAPADAPKPVDAPADGAQAKPAGPDKDGVYPNPGRPLPPRARPWKGPSQQPAGKP
ncbi:MAG: hypothetical protein HY287_08105 [Planctomycetes bacterium]|nr:hypothetical protein [Planctomycetota bacterium]